MDAVFCICLNCQASGATQDYLGTVLALDNGVFRLGIAGLFIVAFRVCQGVFGVCPGHDSHLRALAADDGSSVLTCQAQTLKHQGDSRGALFHLHAAVGAGSGKQIGTGLRDDQIGSADLQAVVGIGGNRRIGECNLGSFIADGRSRSCAHGLNRRGHLACRRNRAAGQQTRRQKESNCHFLHFHNISLCFSQALNPQEISRFPLRQRMASSNCFSSSGLFSRS